MVATLLLVSCFFTKLALGLNVPSFFLSFFLSFSFDVYINIRFSCIHGRERTKDWKEEEIEKNQRDTQNGRPAALSYK
jgi:hypothetical protein